MTEDLSNGGVYEIGAFYTYEIAADERPSDAVVTAVAAMTNRRGEEMNPLYEQVDPDAFDALLGDDGGPVTFLQFSFGGCDVVAEPDRIRVRPPRNGTDHESPED